MSAIVGVFGGRQMADGELRRMLAAMRQRGGDRVEVWRDDGIAMGVARHAWEIDQGIAGQVLVCERDDLVVVSDATLYYRDELRSRIERLGIPVRGESPCELVLAAYRAWGDRCAERLEGDFAFIVWNRRARRLCAARDFAGRRTLCYAQLGKTLVVASTAGGVLAHPDCPADINIVAVAQVAASLFAADQETAYRAVRNVPAGWTLVQRDGEPAELRQHWSPPRPREHRRGRLEFEEAAVELRELLTRAVRERLAPTGVTSIWLSGGWDSTAVFAAGSEIARGDPGRRLLPVSMSYPQDDPGREDELIELTAKRWDAPVHWCDIADVAFLDGSAADASRRDDPFAHSFEGWLRALARGSRAVGARIALDGAGGDQLFQVSEVYLADLLRQGRWIELRREWREKGLRGSGFRNFFRWAIQPVLPEPALTAARLLRGGRPLVGYLERCIPAWIEPEFARAHGLADRERTHTPRQRGLNRADYEMEWYLTHPYFPRVFGHVFAFGLDEGVETRSPLYDARVIEFALSRPREERSAGRETKRLLRRAMEGLLPDEVLRPRAVRTGVTGGFFSRAMREHLPSMLDELLQRPVLGELGVVDPERCRRAGVDYLRSGDDQLGVNLYFTLQAERWMRARLRPADGGGGAVTSVAFATATAH